jgi:hypothetical protein
MARLLILLGILGALLWFLHWFRATPAHRVSQVLRKAALWGLIGVLGLAAATGRLNPIFAAIGAAIPLLLRAAAWCGSSLPSSRCCAGSAGWLGRTRRGRRRHRRAGIEHSDQIPRDAPRSCDRHDGR